jgi:hypothetical protein
VSQWIHINGSLSANQLQQDDALVLLTEYVLKYLFYFFMFYLFIFCSVVAFIPLIVGGGSANFTYVVPNIPSSLTFGINDDYEGNTPSATLGDGVIANITGNYIPNLYIGGM